MTISNDYLSPLVDRLGELKAKVADLEDQISEIRSQLIDCGEPLIEGALFRVTVVKSIQSRLDLAAVREALPKAWLANHTLHTPVTTVRVLART